MIIEKWSCKICKIEFSNIRKFVPHIYNFHKISSKQYYDTYLKKENDGFCLVCKKPVEFSNLRIGYKKYCSLSCSIKSDITQEKIRNTYKNNPEIMEKRVVKQKNTNLIIYGVEYPTQSKEIIEKREKANDVKNIEDSDRVKKIVEKSRQTIRDRNVKNPNRPKQILDQMVKNCLEKYGVKSTNQLESVKEKKKISFQKHYGVDNIFEDVEYIKKCIFDKIGVDSYSKTPEGKLKHRVIGIKYAESQSQNNEPLMPRIGPKERECLNEFQKYTIFNIIRNDPSFRYIVGRFPDGHILQLRLFIQFDEKDHFLDEECKIYKQDDLDCTLQLAVLGYIVFRVSELEWKNNRKKVIDQFKSIIQCLTEKYIEDCLF